MAASTVPLGAMVPPVVGVTRGVLVWVLVLSVVAVTRRFDGTDHERWDAESWNQRSQKSKSTCGRSRRSLPAWAEVE